MKRIILGSLLCLAFAATTANAQESTVTGSNSARMLRGGGGHGGGHGGGRGGHGGGHSRGGHGHWHGGGDYGPDCILGLICTW